MSRVERGVDQHGLHSYIEGEATDPHQADVWQNTNRDDLRSANARAGRLVLLPGNRGGAEFPCEKRHIDNCVTLFSRLDREFDICVVDLSAGRSHAVSMVLEATARKELSTITARWLIFHRWTMAARHGRGRAGQRHPRNPRGRAGGRARPGRPGRRDPLRAHGRPVAQLAAGHEQPAPGRLAARLRRGAQPVGQGAQARSQPDARPHPMEPVLQWREQVITHADVDAKIANAATAEAFKELAGKLTDDTEWEGL
jgi:hypothetical protein